MSKQFFSDQGVSHLPCSVVLMSRGLPGMEPERPACEQILQMEQEIKLRYQSEDEEIFEDKIVEGKRVRNRKTKSSLFVQSQTLKQENLALSRKNQDYCNKIQQLARAYQDSQNEVGLAEININQLTQALKASDKRKFLLQQDLSKVSNQLQVNRKEINNLQNQINSLLSTVKAKDSQVVELMHKNNLHIAQLKVQHRGVVEEYQAKQEETKKLLKKLNSINLQKEQKLKEDLQHYKGNYQKLCETALNLQKTQKKLQDQNSVLQDYIKNSSNKYESDLLSLRNQSDNKIKELGDAKEIQINRILLEFKQELENKRILVADVQHKADKEAVRSKTLIEEKEKTIASLEQRLRDNVLELQSITSNKDNEVRLLREQLADKFGQCDDLIVSREEAGYKNQALEKSIKDIYSQISHTEAKLADVLKQRASLQAQSHALKSEVKQLKDSNLHLENKVSTREMELNKQESEHKHLRISTQKLEENLRYYQKNLRALEEEHQKLSGLLQQQNASNTQLRQGLLEKEVGYEALRQKYSKMQSFLQNHKAESERMREATERKWRELKVIYQKQMEQLESKVLSAEEAYKGIKLKLQMSQRENKMYEFESTMTPSLSMGSTIYFQN